MPKFDYVALDHKGKEMHGTLEVGSQNEAIARLKEMQYFPTNITEAVAGRTGKGKTRKAPAGKKQKGGSIASMELRIPFLSGRVKPKLLCTFTRQLATLVDAGLPLLRGLRVLAQQEKNSTLRRIIGELGDSIEGGSTFSEALSRHPKVFNKLFVNMVKAGEMGGVLEVVLNRLAEFMEKAEKIKGKVKAALFYPVAVIIVAVGILALLMVVVVPKFEAVFADMFEGGQLPGFTRFVIDVSNLIATNFLQTSLVVLGCFILFWLLIKTRWGRWGWDKLKLNFPILGPVISKVAISRFTRTLGTLVSSGVPILQALTIVRETTGNVILTNAVLAIHENVKEGETITIPMEKSRVFPPMVISMVDVGEQTGALPEMLMRVADNYDEEVDNAVAAMTSLLEPILIVFLGVVVGGIVIALFLPLISMIDKLAQ